MFKSVDYTRLQLYRGYKAILLEIRQKRRLYATLSTNLNYLESPL